MNSPFPRAARPSAVPWGLFGMVALMVACEQFLTAHDEAFLAPIPSDWREAAIASSTDAAGCEVLCLGDSQIKKGVIPQVLRERLGSRSYNLAVIGGQPASSYFLLRRALEAGARPRALIVGSFPGLLTSDVHINNRQWPEVLSICETIDVAWHAHDGHWLVLMLLARVAPSIKMRREIRSALLLAARGQENTSRREAQARREEHKACLGAELAPVNPAFHDEAGPLDTQALRHRWKCKSVHLCYIRRMLELAHKRGVAVYWLTSTLSPAWQARREQLGLDAPYDELLRSLQRDFTNLTVVDIRHAGIDASLFADAGHLDERGARAVTSELAAFIAKHQPTHSVTPRWVALKVPAGPEPQVASGAGRGHQ